MRDSNIFRGDILGVVDGLHRGEQYTLVRTTGPVRAANPLGAKVGPELYAYNLVNEKNGAARQSEPQRMFFSENDGINQPVSLAALRAHFGMDLMPVTSKTEIADDVKGVIQRHTAKHIDRLSKAVDLRAMTVVGAPSIYGAVGNVGFYVAI